tara:strand:+ start:6296 stop:7417 length:1122 start_codon:yes stop_codon:yes gene_type:complete
VTLVSICIPIRQADAALASTVRRMLGNRRTDFEILIGDFTDGKLADLQLLADELRDPRLRVVVGAAEHGLTVSAAWNETVAEARGAWISIIGAADYIDPDVGAVIEATIKRVPDADCLSWSRARYVPPALRQGREIAVIGTGSRLLLPEQKDAMRNLFYWDGASDRPDCPFGAWHGAVRRDLLERIREAFSGVWFEQAAADIDSACKTVTLARRMMFWERPLSVQGAAPTPPAAAGSGPPFADFPFQASIGPAAAAALGIEAFKRRYGIELQGWEDNFLKACVKDCETAATGEQFHAKKTAYAEAILAWRGKRALAAFKPEFRRKPKLTRFQGVRDGHLHLDMAMDHTETAAEFYRLIDALLFPVHLLDDKLA